MCVCVYECGCGGILIASSDPLLHTGGKTQRTKQEVTQFMMQFVMTSLNASRFEIYVWQHCGVDSFVLQGIHSIWSRSGWTKQL